MSEKDKKSAISNTSKGLSNFIWNKETKEFCGRSGHRWGEVGVYYFFYYSWLISFYAAFVCFFYSTLESDRPSLIGKDSLLNNKPGLAFRPNLPNLASLIISSSKNMKDITSSLEDELAFNRQLSTEARGVLQCDKQKDFGFKDKKPCILLKLNKLYDFTPTVASSKPSDLKLQTGETYDKSLVYVQCNGRRNFDKDNIGGFAYYPKQGFPLSSFPWTNQQNYQTPYVWVQLLNMTMDVAVTVECKVFADNIPIDDQELVGFIRFEVVLWSKD